jgi:hypothetical protein
VSLDQAWHDRFSASIEHSRSVTDELLNVGIRTDCHEAASADGGGFDNRELRIDGHELAIQHDEICRWLSPSHDLAGKDKTQGQTGKPRAAANATGQPRRIRKSGVHLSHR